MTALQRLSLVLVAGVLATVGVSRGQTGPDSSQAASQDIAFADFQFNRSLPGAKSLAMAGAFVALADDATAAYSNPAGLTHLPSSEVSMEYRHWRHLTSYPVRGRVSGEVSNIGIDNLDGLEFTTSALSTEGLSFASAVYRPRSRPEWSFIAFHHVLVDFEAALQSQGVFTGSQPPRFGPYAASTAFDVTEAGLGFSYAFGACVRLKRCLRVGAAVARFDLRLASVTRVFRDPGPDGKGTSEFRGEGFARTTTTGEDASYGGSVGVLWESTGRRWSLGGAFRWGPEFTIREKVFQQKLAIVPLRLPHQLALGVAYRPRPRLTLSFEWDRVSYSRMGEDNGFEVFQIPDADELRFGLEKRFRKFRDSVTGPQLLVMGGAWLDPNHRIAFEGATQNRQLDMFRNAYFRADRADDVHLTGGFGLKLPRLLLLAAFDDSDKTTTYALSTVVYF